MHRLQLLTSSSLRTLHSFQSSTHAQTLTLTKSNSKKYTCVQLLTTSFTSSSSCMFHTKTNANATIQAQSTSNTTASNNLPHSIVITTAGPDRPGIVHDLSRHIADCGGNIEESRMTILGGDFALLLRVTIPPSISENDVEQSLRSIFPSFLIGTRRTTDPKASEIDARYIGVTLEGPDQPGVVAGLTNALLVNNISIRDLDTNTTRAAFAGYRIFSLTGILNVPRNVSLETVARSLDGVEDEFGCEIEIREIAETATQSDETPAPNPSQY